MSHKPLDPTQGDYYMEKVNYIHGIDPKDLRISACKHGIPLIKETMPVIWTDTEFSFKRNLAQIFHYPIRWIDLKTRSGAQIGGYVNLNYGKLSNEC